MFWFVAGASFGACVGTVLTAICVAGARADQCRECKARGAEWTVER